MDWKTIGVRITAAAAVRLGRPDHGWTARTAVRDTETAALQAEQAWVRFNL